MFDYNAFKKKMNAEGHTTRKRGNYIRVVPNNNIRGYAKGFMDAWQIIPREYWEQLDFVGMEHFNTWIYHATFKII